MMSATEKPKERSFPKIEFTDSEAGATSIPKFQEPQLLLLQAGQAARDDVRRRHRRRAARPRPSPAARAGSTASATDPAVTRKDWTTAKSSNWHAFLDPNEEWNQTIFRNNAAVVRQVELCLKNAKRARVYDSWNSAWLTFIERNVGAWMHAENGLALHVFTSIQRSGPTNMINTAVAVNAAHKMRFAQDLALFNLDLSEATDALRRQRPQGGVAGSARVAADPQGRRSN